MLLQLLQSLVELLLFGSGFGRFQRFGYIQQFLKSGTDGINDFQNPQFLNILLILFKHLFFDFLADF